MKSIRHPFRLLWIVGLAVLVASVAGTAWKLHTDAGAEADGAPGASPTKPGVVCFGHVDVEPGIASLYPLQPGRVERVNVKENQEVKAGEVLLSLDKRLAEALVRQARADLEAARIQAEEAQKSIERQKLEEDQQQAAIAAVYFRLKAAEALRARKEELRDTLTNEKELEAARAQCDELKELRQAQERKLAELRLVDPRQDIRRAEADVEAKQGRLDQAEVGLSECVLKAPGDGIVLRLLVSPGDVLGAQPKQPAVLFCPQGPRLVRAEVEQEFAGRVELGMPAVVQDDTSHAVTWRGKVARQSDWYTHRRSMLQEPLQLNDVRTVECLIELDPGQPLLRIGQRVRVVIGGADR